MGKDLTSNICGCRRFENKICIVTGGGQGIGESVARRLGAEGGTIIIADRVEKTSEEVVKDLKEQGIIAELILSDLTQYEEASRLMDEVMIKFGRIDVIVNNVGGTIWNLPFSHYEPEQILKEIDRSFWTTMWSCGAVLPHMLEKKQGSIVNVGSGAARGAHYKVPYSAAKGGVRSITMGIAAEVAELHYDKIRVNCVEPGTIDHERPTPRNLDGVSPQEAKWRKEVKNRQDEINPLRRGRPEEVAAAIAFMASDDASYITGQVLSVSGRVYK